jgi:hypothetical protein
MAVSFTNGRSGPLLVLVLLRILQQRRWRIVSGLFMAFFIMMVVAFLVYPGWGLSFLRGTMANLRWNYGFTTSAIFTHMWPEWGERLGWALTAFLIIVLISEWRGGREADSRRFHWTSCLTLAATPLLGLRTEMQNLVVLLIPLAFIFAVVRERWKGGYWLGGTLLALVSLVPWALFLGAGIPAGLRRSDLSFSAHFAMTGLYWIRWWAIRPLGRDGHANVADTDDTAPYLFLFLLGCPSVLVTDCRTVTDRIILWVENNWLKAGF